MSYEVKHIDFDRKSTAMQGYTVSLEKCLRLYSVKEKVD